MVNGTPPLHYGKWYFFVFDFYFSSRNAHFTILGDFQSNLISQAESYFFPDWRHPDVIRSLPRSEPELVRAAFNKHFKKRMLRALSFARRVFGTCDASIAETLALRLEQFYARAKETKVTKQRTEVNVP